MVADFIHCPGAFFSLLHPCRFLDQPPQHLADEPARRPESLSPWGLSDLRQKVWLRRDT